MKRSQDFHDRPGKKDGDNRPGNSQVDEGDAADYDGNAISDLVKRAAGENRNFFRQDELGRFPTDLVKGSLQGSVEKVGQETADDADKQQFGSEYA